MRFMRLLLAIVGVLALALALGWYFLGRNDNGLPEGFASGNGRIEADQIDVATRLAGRLAEIRVAEGDLVQAGDVLARIETRELEAELAHARAAAASAQSQVEEVRALIHQREAELRLAETVFARTSSLAGRGVQSAADRDQAAAQRATAQAALEAAKAQLAASERGVEAAEALVAQVETQIADATLTAPVFGRVLYRLAQPGEVLGSGGKVVTLVDLSQIYMDIFLPANAAMLTTIGAEARITLDSIPYAVPAFVSFVSPEAQFTPSTVETAEERADLVFRVRVRVPEELVRANIDFVRTGLRGIATVRLAGNPDRPWPAEIVGEPLPAELAPQAAR